MLETDNYVRFERVSSVAEADRGLLAELHDEQLRIDLIRDDLVRFKISRARQFDESPTFAVCVDPLETPVEFRVERDADRVRLITAAMVVSLWLHPFRLDVHRTDGSVVIETAADHDGQYWAYATLNDAFTLRRRCRQEDAIFGLGREDWPAQPQRPRLHHVEHRRAQPVRALPSSSRTRRPATRGVTPRASTSTPTTSSIPFFYHQTYPDGRMAASFVDNGYRGSYEFSEPERVPDQFPRRSIHRVHLRRS